MELRVGAVCVEDSNVKGFHPGQHSQFATVRYFLVEEVVSIHNLRRGNEAVRDRQHAPE
ncbi:hypothetical protein CEP54_014787, partial [Fusarium duplospermum]